ncbi:hypothetical protein Tco_0717905 [Tanacetum coccineum]
MVVSDFISNVVLGRHSQEHPTNIKNILLNFGTLQVFKDSTKVWFSTPTGGIKGEVGVISFRNAIGANYLAYSKDYVKPLTIKTVREWFLTIGYALGWHLEGIHVTWAQLEKKRTRLRLYTNYLEEKRTVRGDGITNYKRRHQSYQVIASCNSRRHQNEADLKDPRRPLRHDGEISTYIDSRLENIDQFLNGFTQQPNEIDVDSFEHDNESVDTPLVSPFLDSNDDSDDIEVLNELEEYDNARKLCRQRAINSFDGGDLAFQWSFTYIMDFVVLKDIGNFIVRNMAEVVMGKPFRKFTKLEYDCAKGLMNGYEKNKLMYKNCLNLDPEYQVDESMKEWLICGHVIFDEKKLGSS